MYVHRGVFIIQIGGSEGGGAAAPFAPPPWIRPCFAITLFGTELWNRLYTIASKMVNLLIQWGSWKRFVSVNSKSIYLSFHNKLIERCIYYLLYYFTTVKVRFSASKFAFLFRRRLYVFPNTATYAAFSIQQPTRHSVFFVQWISSFPAKITAHRPWINLILS